MPRAIHFWSEALDYRPLREPDMDWAILVPKNGPGPQLPIKLVSSQAESHQRHHLDLYAQIARQRSVEPLLGLGARRVEWNYEGGADYVVLADKEGTNSASFKRLNDQSMAH